MIRYLHIYKDNVRHTIQANRDNIGQTISDILDQSPDAFIVIKETDTEDPMGRVQLPFWAVPDTGLTVEQATILYDAFINDVDITSIPEFQSTALAGQPGEPYTGDGFTIYPLKDINQ